MRKTRPKRWMEGPDGRAFIVVAGTRRGQPQRVAEFGQHNQYGSGRRDTHDGRYNTSGTAASAGAWRMRGKRHFVANFTTGFNLSPWEKYCCILVRCLGGSTF